MVPALNPETNAFAKNVCAMYCQRVAGQFTYRRNPFLIDDRHFGGFAIVATLMVMILLSMVAVAFLTLATVQVRDGASQTHRSIAQTNARLALMIALGELQRDLGPDQRVSASTALLEQSDRGKVEEKHWTGVWQTTTPNGSSFYRRNEETGGLEDRRKERPEAMNFLVSGNQGGFRAREGDLYRPSLISKDSGVRLVGPGSVGVKSEDYVNVLKVPVSGSKNQSGHYGYWVGDLGVKANLVTPDPYAKETDSQKFLPFLGANDADASAIEVVGKKLNLDTEDKDQLLSQRTFDLWFEGDSNWRKETFHDITVHSRGLQVNVRDGGLKKNLSVFLNQDQDIAPLKVSGRELISGLSANDNLVGPRNQASAELQGLDWSLNKYSKTSPKFGLLRDWARLADQVAIQAGPQQARLPESEVGFQTPEVLVNSSQNLNPATLTSFDHASLSPILVEGSMFNTFSAHLNPPGSRFPYNIRSHDFPRVVLWNPYSVQLSLPSTVVVLQVNGRRGFRTDAWIEVGGRERFLGMASWLDFGGRTEPEGPVVGSDAYDDAYTGSYYFALEEVTFEPGECLVFLPDKAAEYDEENILNNTLSVSADYDFRNNYYHSASEFDEENPDEIGGMAWYPKRFWYAPSDSFFDTGKQLTQGDDSQMILKAVGGRSQVAPEDFDNLRQIAAVSCSLQFGAGREPPEAWYHDVGDPNSGVTIEFLDLENPVVTIPPDRRTRQGYRMRWFQEHPSHLLISNNGLQAQPEAWEEAFFANWNLRASYASRSPFENLIGNRGDGSASGPWFFGIYTKDLYDEAVSWFDQTPVRWEGQKNHGYPFGKPVQGAKKYILFDVPRTELGVVSLAQFQHVQLSNFVWHPSYAVGNSLVDPRLGLESQRSTVPQLSSIEGKGGFTPDFIGWSTNRERGLSEESWAQHGRAYYHDLPENENLVYDLSFEVNQSLWDEYFLSSGTTSQLERVGTKSAQQTLPNPRMVPLAETQPGDLNNFHKAAAFLFTEGTFNVNSTSVDAWRAVLSANRKSNGLTPFPRIIGGERPDWTNQDSLVQETTWNATRQLNDEEIERLAEEIVREVKLRGPFLSLADFVNRRLADGEAGKRGVIETAIYRAGLNSSLADDSDFRLFQQQSLVDYDHPDHILDPTLLEQLQKPESTAWGAPIYLTQADVLQAIGSSLSARSDTFVVRAYGDCVVNGKVVAKAWCEAVIQRFPEPMRPDPTGLNPDRESDAPNFGRRFRIQRFRWLAPNEV